MTEMEQKTLAPRRWALIAVVTVPTLVVLGFLSGRAANAGYGNPWFDALVKPAIMPPGWAFGVAWAILYAVMGIATARILASPPTPERRNAIALFLLQLALNLAWTPLFFGAHQVFGGLALLIAILFAAVATTFAFGRVDRTAALLMIPYLAWLVFATLLNFRLLQLNQ